MSPFGAVAAGKEKPPPGGGGCLGSRHVVVRGTLLTVRLCVVLSRTMLLWERLRFPIVEVDDFTSRPEVCPPCPGLFFPRLFLQEVRHPIRLLEPGVQFPQIP